MSAGYAARLRPHPHKGVCGLPERPDTVRRLAVALPRLVERLCAAGGRAVILTGAGVSTAAGIPDFRGPDGVWTREQREAEREGRRGTSKPAPSKKRKREAPDSGSDGDSDSNGVSSAGVDFAAARPTLTHRAVVRLLRDGWIRCCVTQNVDGLHQRSGLPRARLAVLHGCAFTERCERTTCRTEVFHDRDLGGMSFRKTGNHCPCCGGDMRDTLLDWDDPLPEEEWERAQDECDQADLVLCLGTSLRIEPAGSLPLRAKEFVIVNLQVTPYDQEACMVIRDRVDSVMSRLMEQLGYVDWEDEPSPPINRVWSPSKITLPDNDAINS